MKHHARSIAIVLTCILAAIWVLNITEVIRIPGKLGAHNVTEILSLLFSIVSAFLLFRSPHPYFKFFAAPFLACGVIDGLHGILGYHQVVTGLANPEGAEPHTVYFIVPTLRTSSHIMLAAFFWYQSFATNYTVRSFKKMFLVLLSVTLTFSVVFPLFPIDPFIVRDFPIIHRPWALIPLCFTGLCLCQYYSMITSDQRYAPINLMLYVSVCLCFFAALSDVSVTYVFDRHFNLGHWLKTLCYAAPVIGFLIVRDSYAK